MKLRQGGEPGGGVPRVRAGEGLRRVRRLRDAATRLKATGGARHSGLCLQGPG